MSQIFCTVSFQFFYVHVRSVIIDAITISSKIKYSLNFASHGKHFDLRYPKELLSRSLHLSPGVSLRIVVAGEECKVTGEYFARAKPFPGKSLKMSQETLLRWLFLLSHSKFYFL